MSGDIVQLNDFRKKPEPVGDPLDQPMGRRDQDIFATDTVADQWANDLVHGMMKDFYSDPGVDPSDPVYAKLMEAMAGVARSMTRHHLDVFDVTALTLKKHPDSILLPVEAVTPNEMDGSDG